MLTKDRLNAIEVSISKTLVNPYITHDQGEFISANNILKEYDPRNWAVYQKENILFWR